MDIKVINAKKFAEVSVSPYRQVIEAVLQDNVIKATRYISPTSIIRAVKKTYKFNGRNPRREGNVEITLTIGKPNYAEREFIKLLKKANEPFPVKKMQLKLYNPKKNKLKRKLKKV